MKYTILIGLLSFLPAVRGQVHNESVSGGTTKTPKLTSPLAQTYFDPDSKRDATWREKYNLIPTTEGVSVTDFTKQIQGKFRLYYQCNGTPLTAEFLRQHDLPDGSVRPHWEIVFDGNKIAKQAETKGKVTSKEEPATADFDVESLGKGKFKLIFKNAKNWTQYGEKIPSDGLGSMIVQTVRISETNETAFELVQLSDDPHFYCYDKDKGKTKTTGLLVPACKENCRLEDLNF